MWTGPAKAAGGGRLRAARRPQQTADGELEELRRSISSKGWVSAGAARRGGGADALQATVHFHGAPLAEPQGAPGCSTHQGALVDLGALARGLAAADAKVKFTGLTQTLGQL
jgi:hypothetical protein